MVTDVRSRRRDIAEAALASGAAEVVSRTLAIALTIVAARVLEPKEVGLIGLATILIGVMAQIAFYAETAAVTGNSAKSDSVYGIAAVVIRGVLTIALIGLSLLTLPMLAGALAAREAAVLDLAALIKVLYWQLVLELGGTYPRVLLQRHLLLKSLVFGNLVGATLHVSLASVLLVMGFGPMGVVWACLIGSGVTTLVLWFRAPRRPVSWREQTGVFPWRETTIGTAKVFIGSILGFVNARIDNLLVAGVLGPTAMSFYGMAWNASRMPIVILHQALGVVLVPAVARMQSDPRSMELMLRDSLRHAYLLLAPLIAFLYVSGPSLVTSILGAKWLPLVPSLRIMLVTVLVGPILTVCNSLLIGTGRQHLPGMASVGQFVVVVVLVVPLASHWGLVGAAAADAVSAGVLTVGLLMIARLARPEIRLGILRSVALPIPGACVAGFVAEQLGNSMPFGPIRLVCEGAAVFTSYLIVLTLFGGRESLAEVVVFLKSVVTHRPPPVANPRRLM